MSDIFASLKKTWMKGMEAVSNTASSIAENTKQKVNLMNLENRRKEILEDFGMIAYELWQKGEIFPDALDKQLKELSLVDAELAEFKAKNAPAEEPVEEPAPEEEAAALEAPVMDMPEDVVQEEVDETPVPVMEIPEEEAEEKSEN